MGTGEVKNEMDFRNWYLGLTHDQWITAPVSGPRPAARCKHAALVDDEKLYISGGSHNGRYLSDVQVFDLKELMWSTLKLTSEPNTVEVEDGSLPKAFPAISGHSMIKWGHKLILLGGNSKKVSHTITVWFIDLETHNYGIIKTSGEVPIARSGHSVTLVGSRLIMFGGEDNSRHLLNDVHILNLETIVWNVMEARQEPPAPRYDHTAVLHANRYLFIFGGCSHAICFNDLHVLDLETMEWSQPQTQGDMVTPRAGHGGLSIDENWFIVGGGDNKRGASETLVLNMSKLVWSVLTSVKGRDPLASEGLSVCSALIDGEKYLVAFGGYNGKCNNEVSIMRPKSRASPRPKIFQSPAAAAAAASVTAAYALTKSGRFELSEVVERRCSQQELSSERDALKEGKSVLELSLKETRAEIDMLSGKIEEVGSTYTGLSKELHSVQSQLVAERSRCFNLEAQIAELEKMLSSFQPVEDEVRSLRRQKSEREHDMERTAGAQRQGSGGVLRWIVGGT